MKWTNILQQHNDNRNMTRKEAGQGVMTMAWDDENRLLEVKNEGNEVSRYRYGHDGERVLKSTPDGQTTYVNEYLTIRAVRGADGSQAVRSRVATKHIFAGSERVATKRVDSTGTKLAESLFNKANCNASANSVIGFFVDVFMRNKTSCPNTNASDSLFTNASAVVEEKEAYFYHSDHLGSIGIVTRDGELHDYTVFLPFGEQWIFQSTNQAANDQTANGDGLNPLSPFQFTGKELDKYTGLTYFGARYYDPRTSIWLSADPILISYLGSDPDNLKGMGGVFNTKNMNLYGYTFQNPMNLIDPDGMETALVFTTEDEDTTAWSKAAEFAKKQALELCKACTDEDVKVYDVNRAEDFVDALKSNKDIELVFVIGHSSENSLYLGTESAPGTNISVTSGVNNITADQIDWNNLTDNAKVLLYGCHAGTGPIAQSIANSSGATVLGPNAFLNFETDTGKPFIRTVRKMFGGQWNTFSPNSKPLSSNTKSSMNTAKQKSKRGK